MKLPIFWWVPPWGVCLVCGLWFDYPYITLFGAVFPSISIILTYIKYRKLIHKRNKGGD